MLRGSAAASAAARATARLRVASLARPFSVSRAYQSASADSTNDAAATSASIDADASASASATATAAAPRVAILPPLGTRRAPTVRSSVHSVGGTHRGQTYIFETGRIASSSDGSVTLRCGDNVVLASVLPLEVLRQSDASVFVEYRERAAAFGRIPTTATRREFSSTEKEILTSQQIERLVRPLLSPWHFFDVRLSCVALSGRESFDFDVLAINAASAALAISSVPFGGPFGAARVAVVDGRLSLSPDADEIERASFHVTVAVSPRGVQMIDAAGDETDPRVVEEAVEAACGEARQMLEWQEELVRVAGRNKKPERFPSVNAEAYFAAAVETCGPDFSDIFRDTGLSKVRRWVRGRKEHGKIVCRLIVLVMFGHDDCQHE